MKKSTFLSGVCLVLCALSMQTATAQSTAAQAFKASLGMYNRISFIEKAPVQLAQTSLTNSLAQNRQHVAQLRKAAQATVQPTASRPAKVGFKVSSQYVEQLDSIITNIKSTGESYSRTTFEYYPNSKLPKRGVSQLYMSGEWQTQEEWNYTWDKDGYCLLQSVVSPLYNYGEKHEYVYNDQKLGIQQIISQYTDGQWVPSQKGEYAYDERGNMIEEHTYTYDAANQTWVKANWTKASYDANNYQSHVEGYYWDGTAWQSAGDMQDVAYTDYGYITQLTNYKWLADSKEWMAFYKVNQEWNENRLNTKQEMLYYNPDKQDWVGCYEWDGKVRQCAYSACTYDDVTGIMTSDMAYSMPEPDGKYVKGVETYYDITQLDNGDYRTEAKTYYVTGDTKELRDTTVRNLRDAIALPESQRLEKLMYNRYLTTYLYETVKPWDTNEWTPQFEYTYNYNKDLKLESSVAYNYTQDSEHKKIADISEQYIFDDHGNVVDSYYKMGQGTGADDWQYSSRFTYEYENDSVRINKLNYRWNAKSNSWKPGWGEGNSYDYSVPVENIVMWLGTNPYHKITEARRYVAAGDEFDCQVGTYYYSGVTTGITAAAKDLAKVQIAVNGRTLTIQGHADRVVVNNCLGQTLLASTAHTIDLSAIPSGIYIVTTQHGGKTASAKVVVK